MTSTLKAIPTIYHGHKYDSRTEARWAVFFQTVGIAYEPHPQGYDLDGTWYLVDFWLPQIGCFVEVKPTQSWLGDEVAVTKGKALARIGGHRVIVLAGDIPYPHPGHTMEYTDRYVCLFPSGDEDWPYWFCECMICGQIGVEFEGRTDRLLCGCARRAGLGKAVNYAGRKLVAAYEAARLASFEHGETPH